MHSPNPSKNTHKGPNPKSKGIQANRQAGGMQQEDKQEVSRQGPGKVRDNPALSALQRYNVIGSEMSLHYWQVTTLSAFITLKMETLLRYWQLLHY